MNTPLRIYRPPEREGLTRLASFGLHLYIPDGTPEAVSDELVDLVDRMDLRTSLEKIVANLFARHPGAARVISLEVTE